MSLHDDVALCFKQHAEQRTEIARLQRELKAVRAEVVDLLQRCASYLGTCADSYDLEVDIQAFLQRGKDKAK